MVSKTVAIIVAVVVIIVVVVGVVVFLFMGSGGGGGTLSGSNINIYCKEYGFGTSASNVGSPGPKMELTAGQTVTVTLHNVGTLAHNWALTTDQAGTNIAFSGAVIASASNPVPAGSSQSVTFTVGSAGNYYYACQVAGHDSLGMWGPVTVT